MKTWRLAWKEWHRSAWSGQPNRDFLSLTVLYYGVGERVSSINLSMYQLVISKGQVFLFGWRLIIAILMGLTEICCKHYGNKNFILIVK